MCLRMHTTERERERETRQNGLFYFYSKPMSQLSSPQTNDFENMRVSIYIKCVDSGRSSAKKEKWTWFSTWLLVCQLYSLERWFCVIFVCTLSSVTLFFCIFFFFIKTELRQWFWARIHIFCCRFVYVRVCVKCVLGGRGEEEKNISNKIIHFL